MSSPHKQLLEKITSIRRSLAVDIHGSMMEEFYAASEAITSKVITTAPTQQAKRDRLFDRIATSKIWGFPLMFLLFSGIFWITITGANYPSAGLTWLLVEQGHTLLRNFAQFIGVPSFFVGMIIDGGYLATAWVVAVMLPPMAIFFPLFTILEDFGYLPRVAFNLDGLFRRAGAHGKQALSMMMGFGCNAAGVIATRIIDSPRERIIAILTNNFSLCNGRWPTQILIATIFIGSLVPAYLAGFVSAMAVMTVTLLGVLFTFLVSWLLSRTVLRGEVSTFSLELPPYRPPRIVQTLYTSLIDRTLVVLWRAVVFAFPCGIVIWLLANLSIAGTSLAEHLIYFFEPFGRFVGLNGVIILAYIVAVPANEIVIPTILMFIVLVTKNHEIGSGAGVLFNVEDHATLLELFKANGWTVITGINLMLFSLLHNPCSTAIYTIYKETKSLQWTALATFGPILLGLTLTTIMYWFF